MSIFFLSAVIQGTLSLKRTCPKCKRGQIVPASKNQESAACKFCGADMPPRK